MFEYKVLSQNDKWLTGKFDPVKLEQALNHYAKQGWRVVSCVTATLPNMMGSTAREEMITVLERRVGGEEKVKFTADQQSAPQPIQEAPKSPPKEQPPVGFVPRSNDFPI